MTAGVGDWRKVLPVSGFRLGVAKAGIKQPDRWDLVVMSWTASASVAGVFTQNHFCAAPVQISRSRLRKNPGYFLVNTGNANAGTGQQGLNTAMECCKALSKIAACSEEAVLPFSTGVIGEQLPAEKILSSLPEAFADLAEDNWQTAARGILTTDTRPKGTCRQFEVDGKTYTVSGVSKGSGMIKPNMATMLAFIATDAAVEKQFLQKTLSRIVDKSFNRITVDGDTSTNDACMLVATGAAGNTEINGSGGKLQETFVQALEQVSVELAQAIVRDGEGATKFVSVRVEEAASVADALEVAYTVAHSPLVKTALFASDPNWGRILAAIGRAGIDSLHINKVSVWLDDVAIVANGEPAPGYTEAAGQAVFNREEFMIRISLGAGDVAEEIWTTDLSYDYVKINADYRS